MVLNKSTAPHLQESIWQNHPIYRNDFFERTKWQYFQLLPQDVCDEFQERYEPDSDDERESVKESVGRSYNHAILLIMEAIQKGENIAYNLLKMVHFEVKWFSAWRSISSLRFMYNDRCSIELPISWLNMMRKEKETYLRMSGKYALFHGQPRLAERFFRASKVFEEHDVSIDDEDFEIDKLIAHAQELQPLYPSEKI